MNTAVNQFVGQRRKMVEEYVLNRGIKNFRLAEAMSRVPRHYFVQESLQHRAYGDSPLPIGQNQTISQPYEIARMTDALNLTGSEWVLEIGTGSGYQTAILAEMAEKVFTIERIKSIASAAHKRLDALGYMNIVYKIFDGTYGWLDQGPFDAILITAAGPEIPSILIGQLKDGGRLVSPVGEKNQELILLQKQGDQTSRQSLGECSFVPLIGKYGIRPPA